MSNASTVLYDTPGPVTKRRQRLLSTVAGLLILGVFVAGISAMYRNGVFDERWLVLVDPPERRTIEATAKTVWVDRLLYAGLVQGTLKAAGLAIPLAAALAMVLVVLRTSSFKAVSLPAKVIIEIWRGLPVLLMMLFGIYVFGLTTLPAVVFGLVIYNAAIFAEILRAGLAALASGQGEAGLAIGLTKYQNFFMITLPQAIRIMLPSLIAQLVVLLKDTSIGFIVGYTELLRTGVVIWEFYGETSRIPFFMAVLLIYLVVNFSLTRLAILIEARLRTRGQKVKLPGAIAATTNPKETGV